ncbi:glycosyltransferase [Streptomyces lycii]|uniref:Glycosyltransferase family 1 protein n=1 Tax=Streptomyces lycii TaxID=2654337 RepID=A0ABQ7FNU1_9ACTN|nr:glycosyltransferase [Streptomyces lycii]KAF4408877.1 glycosyltransferase family 1 protein [Streptomyces lycii]
MPRSFSVPPGARDPSVAVLVELERNALEGGHLKCWERFAEAAAALEADGPRPDLTVYVLGPRQRVEPLSDNVRFVTLRPVAGTAPLDRWLGPVDTSDLAPHHPRLAALLPRHDVWHLTHSFAFATTAVRLARRAGHTAPAAEVPGLVGSVHTDVPALTEAYVRRLAARWGVRPPAALSPEQAAAALLRHRRDRLLRACDRVLVSTPGERAEIGALLGPGRVSLLGRGIDHRRFRPDPAARAEVERAYGVPAGVTAVLFAGRADASKRVLVLAEAVRLLRAAGRPVHLVVAGTGPDTGRIASLLGDGVTLLGTLPQERLARVYAGCDLLAFPSRSETAGNVVAEAMACGLPVVLPAGARTARWLAAPGADGLLVRDDDAAGWASAVGRLAAEPDTRAEMALRAARTARLHHRSWERVLREDVLPHWYAVTPERRRATRSAA